jgi:hypothetical protein
MVVGDVVALVEEVAEACAGPDDLAVAKAGLVSLRRVQSWCAAQQVVLAGMLGRCTPAPEPHLAETGRVSQRTAGRLAERSRVAEHLPALGESLQAGAISGEHLDAVARTRAGLTPEERERFDERAGRLAEVAARTTPEAFAREVAYEAQRARQAGSGDRLDAQRRASRCRTWVDPVTGMWCLRLETDPATGLRLDPRIREAMEAAAAGGTPPTCPTDPFEKLDHRRALAVAGLLEGEAEGGPPGRPEVVVVVDTRCATHGGGAGSAGQAADREPPAAAEGADGSCTEPGAAAVRGEGSCGESTAAAVQAEGSCGESTAAAVQAEGSCGESTAVAVQAEGSCGESTAAAVPAERSCSDAGTWPAAGPVLDWGLPVELPDHVLLELYPRAVVHPVIVRGGVVLHAPGRLDLGRTTRVANAAQRRVLRALYPSCAIPSCEVRFHHCEVHHVVWWRHGGSTDLANLLPLCVRHHGRVHDDGWQLSLSGERQLVVTLPDGTRLTTGPPRRRAA